MDEKLKFSISLEQWQIIDRIDSIIRRYKSKRYNKTNISIDNLLEIHKGKPKVFSWYSDGNGLTLEGYVCLLAKKYSIPTYVVFVLLDVYYRYRLASRVREADRHALLMYQVLKIKDIPYFTLNHGTFLSLAFEEVYSYTRYYVAVSILVRKGLLLCSEYHYKTKKLYTLSPHVLADLDIIEGALSKLEELSVMNKL